MRPVTFSAYTAGNNKTAVYTAPTQFGITNATTHRPPAAASTTPTDGVFIRFGLGEQTVITLLNTIQQHNGFIITDEWVDFFDLLGNAENRPSLPTALATMLAQNPAAANQPVCEGLLMVVAQFADTQDSANRLLRTVYDHEYRVAQRTAGPDGPNPADLIASLQRRFVDTLDRMTKPPSLLNPPNTPDGAAKKTRLTHLRNAFDHIQNQPEPLPRHRPN